jgi:hypothetical protein
MKVVSKDQGAKISELRDSEQLQRIYDNLGEVAKGPLLTKVASLRVYLSRADLHAEEPVWLVIRKRTESGAKNDCAPGRGQTAEDRRQ